MASITGHRSTPFAVQRGAVMRVTVLDDCGLPFDGQCVSAISKGWSEVALSANTQDSETTSVPNARGEILATATTPAQVLGYGANATFVRVEPIVFSMLTGASMKIDPLTNKVVGFGVKTGARLAGNSVGLELWAETPGQGTCDPESPDAEGQYLYQVLPWLQGGVLQGWSLNADFVTFSIEGMTSKDGNAWGQGPYNDVYLSGAGGTVGPLPAGFVQPNEPVVVVQTQVAPPEATGDCYSSGTTPTIATAGNPGTFNGGWRPDTLADLKPAFLNITASPTTAWTTGQHVVLGDGSKAHWSSTAWVAGPA